MKKLKKKNAKKVLVFTENGVSTGCCPERGGAQGCCPKNGATPRCCPES